MELVSIGEDKSLLEKFLGNVKGLVFSPAEIVNSCPCLIAVNISAGAAQKLQQYLDKFNAKVNIYRHGKLPLPPSLKASNHSETPRPEQIQPTAHKQEHARNTSLVHTSALPVQTPPLSASASPTGQNFSTQAEASGHHNLPVKHHDTNATSITLKRSVKEIVKSLQNRDWTVRELAVMELGETPSDGVLRHVTKMLKDDVWHVRCAALDVLSKSGSSAVLKDMSKCVHDNVWHVRYRAVESLGRMESDKSIKPLLQALDDENWQVRQRAVQMLGDTRSERALGGLLACLRDDVWQVRENAARALAKLRSEKSVKGLISVLRDPNWHVRSMAVTALWAIGSERAVNALIDTFHDDNWMVRWKAAYALGKIGSTNILTVLAQMEKKTDTFLQEASRTVLSSVDLIVEPKQKAIPRLEYRAANPYDTMKYIPPGAFIMGADDADENAKPAHQAQLEAYFIDAYEVTNYQYKHFHPSHDYPEGQELYPVVNITWEEAQAYAEWAGKRLPTEAEWEKAARGTAGKIYPWGNEFEPSRCNTSESGNRTLMPVNHYPAGQSDFGVCDMIGNVLEWTLDYYKPYPSSPYESEDFAENFITLRGGSWIHEGQQVTCFTRLYAPAQNANNFIGFRCVKDVE